MLVQESPVYWSNLQINPLLYYEMLVDIMIGKEMTSQTKYKYDY